MAAEDTGFKVEKLNGENYYSWKFQMKMYLIGKDLWELVTGEVTLNAAANPEQQRRFERGKIWPSRQCACLLKRVCKFMFDLLRMLKKLGTILNNILNENRYHKNYSTQGRMQKKI